MLQSDLCILNSLDKNVRFNMGECRNDYGGYFIIDGKEKVIISQEKLSEYYK
jgi:DNA-directed RNA polymerase II subunit RPB2